VTLPAQQAAQQVARSGNQRGAPEPEPESAVVEVLENTLWNRQLGVMSEEIVAALVCQIFEGGRPHSPVTPAHQ
jgi:K+-transporting ATPase c subunit